MEDENEQGPPQEPSRGSGGHSFFQNFQHTPVGARLPERVGRGVFTTGLMILQTNELFVLDFLSMGAPPPQIVARIIMVASHYAQFVNALRSNIDHYEAQFGPIRSHSPSGHVADLPPSPPHSDFPPPPPHGESPAGPAAGDLPHTGGAYYDPHFDSLPPGPLKPGSSDFPSTSAAPKTASPGTGAPGHGSPPRSMPPPEAVTDLYSQVKFPEELMPGSFSDAVMIRHSPEEFSFDFICSLYPRPIVVGRIYLAAGRARGMLETISGALDRFKRFGPPPPPAPPRDQ